MVLTSIMANERNGTWWIIAGARQRVWQLPTGWFVYQLVA